MKSLRLTFVLIILIVITLLTGAYWAIIVLVTLVSLLSIYFDIKNERRSGFLSLMIILTKTFLVALFIRLFFFEIYTIPSGSMENTLISGDRVLVSKLTYGPILPQSISDVPWINTVIGLMKDSASEKDLSKEPFRLKGYGSVQSSDIIVFNSPKNYSQYYIKRCIGLPGDIIQRENRRVLINKHYFTYLPTVKHLDQVRYSNLENFVKYADSLGLQYYISNTSNTAGTAEVFLTSKQQRMLRKSHIVNSVKFAKGLYKVFPFQDQFNWNIDNFGPLKVPKKGFTIALNQQNYILYNKILVTNEGVHLSFDKRKWYINGKLSNKYTFKNNYFFVLGDNRNNTADSRFYGFVPEAYIRGKAICVLHSMDKNGLNWKRIARFL